MNDDSMASFTKERMMALWRVLLKNDDSMVSYYNE